MTERFSKLTRYLPVVGALVLSTAMIATAISQDLDWHLWGGDSSEQSQPLPHLTQPQGIPFAPSPDRDDRTPIPYLSLVFGLGDPTLATKLSGVGITFWEHSGRGSGTLIAPDIVLTTGHLFAENGLWKGPDGLTAERPPASDGRFYLETCGRSYTFRHIRLGDVIPRQPLGLDYAVAVLEDPVCEEAMIMPVVITPLDLARHDDQILLAIGAYEIADVTQYAGHPVFKWRSGSEAHLGIFGVRCQATGMRDTGEVAEGATAVIETEGCDAKPGGSGGALVLSRDGGQTYNLVGVTNSYQPDSEYNNFTQIDGAVARQLQSFVTVQGLSSDERKIARSRWSAVR